MSTIGQNVWTLNRGAKLTLKVVGLLLFTFTLLIAVGLTCSTAYGYMGVHWRQIVHHMWNNSF